MNQLEGDFLNDLRCDEPMKENCFHRKPYAVSFKLCDLRYSQFTVAGSRGVSRILISSFQPVFSSIGGLKT